MKKIKKILLTGATGFIGSHLLELLVHKNYEVIILKRSSSDVWRINYLINKTKYYNIDKSNLENIFRNNDIDYIIHLATFYKKQHQSIEDVKKMIEVNISFPAILLELAIKNNVKYFINTGTFFEYKLNNKRNIKIKESFQIKPYNFYAATKISFENHLKYYTEHYNIKGITLKLFSPYGEKDNEKLMVFLIKNLLNNKTAEMTAGKQRWNFTYVKDIINAYLKALEYIKIMKENYVFFNIGNSETISIKNAAKTLEEISSRKMSVKWGAIKYPKNEIFYVNCNNTKAKNILGWMPQYNIKKGLKKTYLYYLNEHKHENL